MVRRCHGWHDSRGRVPLRISVIVCAHNEARYLPACLHSVLAQSRKPDELLVVNNASLLGPSPQPRLADWLRGRGLLTAPAK